MQHYLAMYLGSAAARARWDALGDDERKRRERAGMKAWAEWAKKNAASIVDGGAPLGKTRRVDPEGVSAIRNALTAYTVVRAASHEAAARLFENHPHFTIFPGESVEVMECLPLPAG